MDTRTILHEIGHNLGMEHNGLGAAFIMEKGPALGGTVDQLSFSEAAIFSAIDVSGGSSIPQMELDSTGFDYVAFNGSRTHSLLFNLADSDANIFGVTTYVPDDRPALPLSESRRAKRLQIMKPSLFAEPPSKTVLTMANVVNSLNAMHEPLKSSDLNQLRRAIS
jgi:hypothetical protein